MSVNKKNILYIWDADYPWDVRVEKICISLKEFGHEIHIASRNLKRNPVHEEDRGLHIHRMKMWKNDRVNYALSFPAFFNPFWKKFLNKIIAQYHIDLIIVRDLPMAVAGIWAGRRHGLPVVFDMAEDYVSMVRDIWRTRKFQGLNLVVRNPYLASLVEKYTLNHIDHVLVVVDEARKLVVGKGLDSSKTTIVGNTPDLNVFHNRKYIINKDDILKTIQNRFSAIYTGGIQMGRGLQTVVTAMPEIISKIPEFLFVVVGDGYAVNKIKELSHQYGVDDHMLWLGWVSHDKIYDYIQASKVGLVPHLFSGHVNTTIPNKIFDYMGFGLPVLATDAIPLKRIITEENCGATYKSGDSLDFSEKFLYLYNNYEFNSNNSIKSINDRYSWPFDEKRLLSVIDNI